MFLWFSKIAILYLLSHYIGYSGKNTSDNTNIFLQSLKIFLSRKEFLSDRMMISFSREIYPSIQCKPNYFHISGKHNISYQNDLSISWIENEVNSEMSYLIFFRQKYIYIKYQYCVDKPRQSSNYIFFNFDVFSHQSK